MNVYLYKTDLGPFFILQSLSKVLTIKSHILCAEKMHGKFDTFGVRLIKTTI